MTAMRSILAGAVLASGVHADWLLSDYAQAVADSATVNDVYGIQSYQNPSSAVTVKVADGAVSLVASKIASDGTEGYTANIGLLHPLTADWAPHDLSGTTEIAFEFRNSAKITDALVVSFGSAAYAKEFADAGKVYELALQGASTLAAGTAWKKGSASIADFATPKWWTSVPDDYPTIQEVLKQVKNLQFAPKTSYTGSGTQNGTACATCVGPTMTSQTLDIRNVVLVGASKHPPIAWDGVPCSNKRVDLDKLFDDAKNEQGGYWFASSDYDSTGASVDNAKGASATALSFLKGDDFASGSVTMKAGLDKRVGTAWHPYAGWAAIGTEITSGAPFEAPTLTGILFHVSAATLPATVEGISFKAQIAGVPDDAVHAIFLPSSQLTIPGGSDFCITPENLVQPSYVTEGRIDFDPGAGIRQLSWEAKIADDRDSTIATAGVEFSVSNVGLFASDWSAVQRRIATRSFVASYANGSLLMRGTEGATALEILSLDGRRVASLAPAARVKIGLPRGSWIVAVRRADGEVRRQVFTVLER